MNTLSRYDEKETPTANEIREDQVRFFTKRLLTFCDSGHPLNKALDHFKEDSYFAVVYPKLAKKLQETPKKSWEVLGEFEDFSIFWKEIIFSSFNSGDVSHGLRALLATASYEDNLNLQNL